MNYAFIPFGDEQEQDHKPETLSEVELTVALYEFVCPQCGGLNKIIQHPEYVYCSECGIQLAVSPELIEPTG